MKSIQLTSTGMKKEGRKKWRKKERTEQKKVCVVRTRTYCPCTGQGLFCDIFVDPVVRETMYLIKTQVKIV